MDAAVTERPTLGTALDRSHNSLNFLRLALAVCVIISHVALDEHAHFIDTYLRRSTLGTMAVYGFFGISGYLIAGSAARNKVGHYLWQRVLRIAPAFWVSLLLTAFLFGPIAWKLAPHWPGSGTLHNYLHAKPDGPVTYVERNALLKINQVTIASTIQNSSLWTLFYEFCCYLVLGFLAMVGLLRYRVSLVILTVAVFVTVTLIIAVPTWSLHFSVYQNWVPMNLLKLSLVFLVGSCLWAYRDVIPDSKWLALGCAIAFYAGLWLPQPTDRGFAAYYLAYPNLAAPLVVYPLLWLGAHLPLQRVGRKNDYSYGIYIYAMPVQFVLFYWGAPKLGTFAFTVLDVVVTVPFAVASWWIIERNALRLKRLHPIDSLRGRWSHDAAPSHAAPVGVGDDDAPRM